MDGFRVTINDKRWHITTSAEMREFILNVVGITEEEIGKDDVRLELEVREA